MKKIKILRIITRLNIGGPAIHVMELADMFNNERYSTTLVYGNVESNEKDMLYLARHYHLHMVNLPAMARSINLFQDIGVAWQLYWIIRKARPDIVHTHTAKAGQVGRLAAWLAGVPVIFHTFHGNNFTGYFNKLLSWFSVTLERLMAGISTCIIAISEQQREELLRYRVAPPSKVRTIPRGLDLDRITHSDADKGSFKTSHNIPAECRLVAFVGRLTAIKNPFLFISIAAYVLQTCPEVIFVFAGDGELMPQLKAKVKELGIQRSFVFAGFLRDLRPLYADMDILLLTSLNEGTPVAVIEAMANGVPVISSRVGGIGDLIGNGESGTLLAPDDEAGFRKAVLDALEDPARYRRMTEPALLKVRRDYSLEGLQVRMTALIEEFTGQKGI